MKKNLKIKFLSCFYFFFFNLLNILIYNIHLRYSLYSLKIFIFLNDYQYVVFLHNTNLNLLAENFTQEEIGEPILDTELVAGDVLYFPRGTIHQVSNFFHEVPQSQPIVEPVLFQPLQQVPSVIFHQGL